ncbi:MAG: hypothetical protein K2N82_00340 [Lachnospiraceae bacterium]|nr:hypothetical protein [Lachnospiraceae bacterium]
MGINGKVKKYPKPEGTFIMQAVLEKDLKSCMNCRFFYGSSRQCIANKCVKDQVEMKQEPDRNSPCYACPYKQADRFCFPCMKKLLGEA